MINDRPTHLRVNLDAVLNNYRKLDKLNGLKTSLAVVKADSYGLGSKVIADYLYKNGVRHFAVATLEEALELKKYIKESLLLVCKICSRKQYFFNLPFKRMVWGNTQRTWKNWWQVKTSY